MITALFYAGLVACAVALILTNFLGKETEKRFSGVIACGLIGYFCLGGYLLGWKWGLGNIAIFFLIGNVLDIPVERLVKRFFPRAQYRMAMSLESQKKFASVGKKLGLQKRRS